MLILGIDPGLQKTGWGVIERQGSALIFIGCGLIKSDPGEPMAQRLADLHRGLARVIEKHRPLSVAVEETFVNRNPASALKLGQARGIAMAVPALYGLDVFEYSANKVKKSVVGNGHADKVQVGMMIKMLLGASAQKHGTQFGADEADALAIAITHAHHRSSVITAAGQINSG